MSERNPQSNFSKEDLNPCIEESDISLKCLQKNNYKYDMCSYEFLNYRACKRFWGKVSYTRKRENIKPFMPTKTEREKILAEKMNGNKSFTGDRNEGSS